MVQVCVQVLLRKFHGQICRQNRCRLGRVRVCQDERAGTPPGGVTKKVKEQRKGQGNFLFFRHGPVPRDGGQIPVDQGVPGRAYRVWIWRAREYLDQVGFGFKRH